MWWEWLITAAVVIEVSPSVIIESYIQITFFPVAIYFLNYDKITWKIQFSWQDQVNKYYQIYLLQVNDYELFVVDLNNLFLKYPLNFD